MSPNLRIDPDLVRSLARTVGQVADDTTGISTTIGTAQRESGLTADGPPRLQVIDETLSLVARTLGLRADLAETFTIDPARFRRVEELSVLELELGNVLTAPARAQVDRILAAIEAVGPIDAYALPTPKRLDEIRAHQQEVADALQEIAAHRDDPAYLHDVFVQLGPDGLHRLLELANAFGYADDLGRGTGTAFADVLRPLAATLGAAQTSGALPPPVEAALLDFGPGDPANARFERLSVDELYAAEDTLAVRRRMLALVLQEGSFSSSFRANAVAEILRTRSFSAGPNPEGFHTPDGSTALTELVALRSLVRDDAAMHAFVTMDHDGDGHEPGDGWYENAALLAQMRDFGQRAMSGGAPWVNDPDEVLDELVTVSSTVIERGLLVVPSAHGTLHDEAERGAYSTMVVAAGRGGVDDRLKRTLATVSAPYTRDLAASYDPTKSFVLKGPSGLVDVTHDDVVHFLQEVSNDKEALARLAANGSAFLVTEMHTQIPRYVAGNDTAFLSEGLGVGTYFAALGDGVNRSNIGKTEAREAMVNGLRMISDPLVGLAVGKVPGAELPVISGLADKASDSLSDAIYGKLIPMPELVDLDVWHSSVNDATTAAVVEMAWQDPELRVRFGGPDAAGLADLERSDPAILAAVQDRFRTNDDLIDLVALTTVAVDSAIVTDKQFKWNEK